MAKKDNKEIKKSKDKKQISKFLIVFLLKNKLSILYPSRGYIGTKLSIAKNTLISNTKSILLNIIAKHIFAKGPAIYIIKFFTISNSPLLLNVTHTPAIDNFIFSIFLPKNIANIMCDNSWNNINI